MQLTVVMPVLGILLMVFSLSNIPPIVVGLIYGEAEISLFLYTFFLTLMGGLSLWLPYRKVRGNLRTRDGFIVTVLFWLVLGLVGSLPFLMMDAPSLSVTDAIFESMSGLTTTGATISRV